jgi:hypothetical protein
MNLFDAYEENMSVFNVYFRDSEMPSSARFGVIDEFFKWISVVMSWGNGNKWIVKSLCTGG